MIIEAREISWDSVPLVPSQAPVYSTRQLVDALSVARKREDSINDLFRCIPGRFV